MTHIHGSRSKSLLLYEFYHIRLDGYFYHPKNLFGPTKFEVILPDLLGLSLS